LHSYNRLREEESPYLQQHATNPVDWYPWGEEAFRKAAQADLPIFLSIGYSTCHWCHVMAEESFADDEVAALINQYFVPIKVDREERPDIDSLYMDVCQAMTGSGGWPLTIFMTPAKKPFYAATYIPKRSKYGRDGLLELLPEIHKLWTKRREDIEKSAAGIIAHLENSGGDNTKQAEIDLQILAKAAVTLERSYDEEFAGFGNAPKFPMPHYLLFLLSYWKDSGDQVYLEMVEKTLLQMRAGGMYDQLGGGFHRYSTDQKWEMPHFEKMLYDQALLIYTYLEAYQATDNKLYADVSEEIISYLEREMLSDTGCFFAAEDADSEGIEGKFYLWDKSELQELLDEAEMQSFQQVFNLKKTKEINLTLKNVNDYQKIPALKEKLFLAREERIRPGKDDKILTDWNGLLIAALAKAGFVLNQQKYINLAKKAVAFIYDNLKNSQGRLAHSYRNGKTSSVDNLNDYSFFLWGLIELHQATLNNDYLYKAEEIADTMLAEFWDENSGGFYFTSADNDELFLRQKNAYDGAIPSGNSVAAFNLIKLAHLTDKLSYQEKAEKMLEFFAVQLTESPVSHVFLLLAVKHLFNPLYEITISGQIDDPLAFDLLERLRSSYLPDCILSFAEDQAKETKVSLCQDFSCGKPTKNLDEIFNNLN